MHIPVIPSVILLFSPSGLTWKVRKIKDSPSIYLTFDDGPIPEVTPLVLNLLNQYNAKATFFCVGDNVKKHPSIFNQIVTEGHAIGNHTFSHLNGSVTDNKRYFEDIIKCAGYVNTNLFRPPHGRMSYIQISKIRKDYKIIMWSVLTGDYNHKLTKDQVLNYAINYTDDGSIVVFHDSMKASERMLYALPKMLDHFSNKGYSFKKLS